MVCDCAKSSTNNHMLSVASKEYQRNIETLVASGRYDTRGDFTVVLQPFFQHTEPVRLSVSKRSHVCFRDNKWDVICDKVP